MQKIGLVLLLVFISALVWAADNKAKDKTKSRDKILPPDTLVVRHDTPPKMIKEKDPKYPRLAKEGGFSGYVIIRAFIDETGKVEKVNRVKCNRPNMGFDEAAMKAVYESTFEPAELKGKPVGVWIKYKIRFDPEKGIKRGPINSADLQ